MTPIKTQRSLDDRPMREVARPESVSRAGPVHPMGERRPSNGDESIVLMRVVNGGFEPFAIGERTDITKYFERELDVPDTRPCDPERRREVR